METLNMTANKYFRAAFLEFFRNYMTIEEYAEYNDISTADAKNLIDAGRKYHEKHVQLCRVVKELKELGATK